MRGVFAIVPISLLSSACAFVAMPTCDVSSPDMLKLCAEPTEFSKDQYKYSETLQFYIEDRQALSKCRAKHKALVETLQSCNQRIEKYNELRGSLPETELE